MKSKSITKCLIALGSNLPSSVGRSTETVEAALSMLCSDDLRVLKSSRLYRSKAVPVGAGPDFINAVAQLETALDAHQLLTRLHEIEHKIGRVRGRRWSARTIDLDLLDFGHQVFPDTSVFRFWFDLDPAAQIHETPAQMILPHPRLQDRAFVLIPLRDVEPRWQHPVTRLSVTQMLAALSNEQKSQITPLRSDY